MKLLVGCFAFLARIQGAISKVKSDRLAKKDVKLTEVTSERITDVEPSAFLPDSHQKALQICESKRARIGMSIYAY